MHHVHVSTGFAFIVLLFIFALIMFFDWAKRQRRAEKLARVAEKARRETRGYTITTDEALPVHPMVRAFEYGKAVNYVHPTSYGSTPVYIHDNSSSDNLLTGMLIGEAMSSGNNQTIVENTNVYGSGSVSTDTSSTGYDNSSSFDTGNSYDSGSSGSSDISFGDTSGSSGGGFDASW